MINSSFSHNIFKSRLHQNLFAGLPGFTLFGSRGFSVSGIITRNLFPPETEFVDPDQCARTAQADLGRYITQRP